MPHHIIPTMFSISSFITDNTNLLNIYLIQNASPDPIKKDIRSNKAKEIQDKFRNWKTTKYIAYYRNHLTYLYDLTDDNQTVFTKVSNNIIEQDNLLIVDYSYNKQPIYIFPCVNDIDYVDEYSLIESKINNRISLIIRKDTVGSSIYIEYKHSPNVDIDKTNSIIQDLLRKLI